MDRRRIIITSITLFSGSIILHLLLQLTIAKNEITGLKKNAQFLGTDGVVMQTKPNNCGCAALKMIFDYYKIPSTLDEIEEKVLISKKGSSFYTLKELAEIKGLNTEGWKLSFDDFVNNIPFPSLLYVNNEHFIIVDSVKNDDVFIRDPAIGRLKLKINILIKYWEGETLVFQDYPK